jgi:hypothetical protein
MTAQISDIYKYDKEEYDIVAMTDPIGFDPHDYGIRTDAPHTACWRGYVCEYDIREDGLVLDNLDVFNFDDEYPSLNGIEVEPAKHMGGFRTYKNLNMYIPYTGRLLLGRDFLRNYYIHMGFQRPYAYKTLIEFVFENGKVCEINDQSKAAESIREKIEKNPEILEEERLMIPQFVEDSFSLDYKTKAWWLSEL